MSYNNAPYFPDLNNSDIYLESKEVQYDDEGHRGIWRTTKKGSKKYFIRDGESPASALRRAHPSLLTKEKKRSIKKKPTKKKAKQVTNSFYKGRYKKNVDDVKEMLLMRGPGPNSKVNYREAERFIVLADKMATGEKITGGQKTFVDRIMSTLKKRLSVGRRDGWL